MLRRKVYIGAPYNTVCMGWGRSEFKETGNPGIEFYGREVGKGVCQQLSKPDFDEGIIANFMAERFTRQGHLAGFFPSWVPSLRGKPCFRVEGACGSGGLALALAARSVISEVSDSVFVCGIEIQNTLKAIYGADVLAGAGHYARERKHGHAYFFPGIFSERAKSYGDRFGKELARKGMASWYETSIENARRNSKAQEYENRIENLFDLGMTEPDGGRFLDHLNRFDCSKVSDGASGLGVFSEAGLDRCGLDKRDCVELVAMESSEENITKDPQDLWRLGNTEKVARKAISDCGLRLDELACLEVHDCFTISGLMALEAIGVVNFGDAPSWVLGGNVRIDGALPVNPSGGLIGFGHPTGASGVRMMADIVLQLTGRAENQVSNDRSVAMMVSMGGNDKTVTALVARKCG